MENTYTPKINLFQERDMGQKINVTMEFLRENFKYLFKIILVIDGPLTLIIGFGYAFYMQGMSQSFENGPVEDFQPASMILGIALVGIAALALSYSFFAIIYRYVISYQNMPPHEITTQHILKTLVRDSWRIFLTSIVLAIAMGMALLVVMVPLIAINAGVGVVVAIFLFLPLMYTLIAFMNTCIAVVMFEDMGAFSAFKKTIKLFHDKWLASTGLAFILYLIQMGVAMIFYIPMYGYMITQMFSNPDDPTAIFGDGSSTDLIIMSILMTITYFGVFLASSISIIGLCFHYFSQREKLEAVGLMDRIDQISAE